MKKCANCNFMPTNFSFLEKYSEIFNYYNLSWLGTWQKGCFLPRKTKNVTLFPPITI